MDAIPNLLHAPKETTMETVIRCSLCAWRIFIAFVIVYATWGAILEFGFQSTGLIVVNLILDFVFVLHISLELFYTRDVKDRRWLVFDGISVLPFILYAPYAHQFVRYGGVLLRVLRVRALWCLLTRLEKIKELNYTATHLLKPVFVFLTSVHCGACLLYFFAITYSDPTNPQNPWKGPGARGHGLSIRRYTRALYWSVMTATTTGYGDLVSSSEEEMAFNIIYMIFFPLIAAYTYGWISSLYPHSRFRRSIQAIYKFAQQNALSDSIREDMVKDLFLKYQSESTTLLPDQIPNGFPKGTRSKILQFLFSPLFKDLKMFQGVSVKFIHIMFLEMEIVYFYPNERIILRGDDTSSLYLKVSGVVELHYPSYPSLVERIVEPCAIGEAGVCSNTGESYTAYAKSVCKCLKVDRGTFLSLMNIYVGTRTLIRSNILEQIYARDIAGTTEVRYALFHIIAAGLRDNNILPLHAAAKHGHYFVVQALMIVDADPDQPDQYGNSPMWYVNCELRGQPLEGNGVYQKVRRALLRQPLEDGQQQVGEQQAGQQQAGQ